MLKQNLRWVLYLSFMGFLTCSRSIPDKVTCFPVQTQSDDLSILYADAANQYFQDNLSEQVTPFPLDWYFYAMNPDSLNSVHYVGSFLKKIGMNRFIAIQRMQDESNSESPVYRLSCFDLSQMDLMFEAEFATLAQFQKSVILATRPITGSFDVVGNGDEIFNMPLSRDYAKARWTYLRRDYEQADSTFRHMEEMNSDVWPMQKLSAGIKSEIEKRENTSFSKLNPFYLEAETKLQAAIKTDSTNWLAFRNLIQIKLVQQRFNDAQMLLKHLLHLKPNDVEGLYYTSFLNEERIKSLGYKNKHALLKKITELDPAWVDAYLVLGSDAYFRNDPRKAIDYYNKLLELNPNSIDGLMALGRVYLVKNEFMKLIPVYEKVLAINPNYADAYYNLGIAYYNNEKVDLAKQFFQKSIELANHENSYLYLGFIYAKEGNTQKAVEYYRDRIELKSGIEDPFAEEARKQLIKLLYGYEKE